MMNKCKCFHHVFAMVLCVLGFVAAIGFFCAAWNSNMVWGFDSDFYFQSVVVLALMAHGTKACKCCCGGMGGMKCGAGNCGTCSVEKPQGM